MTKQITNKNSFTLTKALLFIPLGLALVMCVITLLIGLFIEAFGSYVFIKPSDFIVKLISDYYSIETLKQKNQQEKDNFIHEQ